MKRVTIIIASVGAVAALWAVPSALANNGSRPVAPSRLMHNVLEYYETQFLTGSDAADGTMDDVLTLTLRAHFYEISGPCADSPTTPPNMYNDVRFVRDTMRGDYEVLCQRGPDGKLAVFTPRSQFGSTILARRMDLRQPLLQAGDQAATSVGVPSSGHGSATELDVVIDKRHHTAQADIRYSAVAGRHLVRLRIQVLHGRTTTRRWWSSTP